MDEKGDHSKEKLVEEILDQDQSQRKEDKEKRDQAYQKLVTQLTPAYSTPANLLKAFLVGGAICCVGQILTNFCMQRGLDQETAKKWTSLILVLASAVLTGCNIYPSMAQFAGAGILVPITGFANGIAASALEYKREGQVFGLGAQIFSIGGPVILYGIVVSWLLGLIYWIGRVILLY